DYPRSACKQTDKSKSRSHPEHATHFRPHPRSTSSRRTHDLAREHPLRAVVGRVVDGGESREWRTPMVNKWTRDDLPSISDLRQADDERGNGERTVTLDIALDAVVDRLNKDFPKSYDRGGLRGSTWLERERDAVVARAEHRRAAAVA